MQRCSPPKKTISEFIEGEHVEHLNTRQRKNLIELSARLNKLTRSVLLPNYQERLTYHKPECVKIAKQQAEAINTENARKKSDWYLNELKNLELPDFLPKSICHCDFYYTNILFSGDSIAALLDFDDANYTYCYFDIVSMIDIFVPGFDHDTWESFSVEQNIIDFTQAKEYLKIYSETSPIQEQDKPYLFDIFKLSILVDCLWYFERGDADDFFEKRKIDALNKIGRIEFYHNLFE